MKIPISTYRVQFSMAFRFADCLEIVPYLHELGVGALYSSPRFKARRGSSHGYDVASPQRVNSELGTEEEFGDLCARLSRYGMGLVLDIVPNHMSASHENPWWMDVLRYGPRSAHAHYFDIDWRPATSKAAFLQENKVLLPVLGGLYGDVLERGELAVRVDEEGFHVLYYERKLPVNPHTYGPLLEACRERAEASLGAEHPVTAELRAMEEDGEDLPERVFRLYRDQLDARLAIDAALGNLGERLHELLEMQYYRLANWKIAFEEINYRRFFDINELVCLRVEEPDVFAERHRTVFALIREGKVTGLRVDHVDGLFDPEEYLERLEAGAGGAFFVVVEKVLGRGETIPEGWRACGTTGYDFLNAMNDLLLDADGLRAVESAYRAFTGSDSPFAEVCYERNKQVMWKLFAGEVAALGHELGKLAACDRRARDLPLSELIEALVETTACLPVYRTYARGDGLAPRDRATLERTLSLARRRTSVPHISDESFAFLRRVLLMENLPTYAPELPGGCLRFLRRWQQFTGPVMAKGLEDTAYYAYTSLLSRNEVGGDPIRESPPAGPGGFHDFLSQRSRCTMNATATHDTKRGEDARARLNVLTECAGEWTDLLNRWARRNARYRRVVNGLVVPTPEEEVLIYQTLLGHWPVDAGEESAFKERLRGFLRKAVREAKDYSGWILPDEAHEQAVEDFAMVILEEEEFRSSLLRFGAKAAWHGMLNSLTQTLVKITAPGVPDFYQGTELWDLSMVDPDNRRPVDFARRKAMLEELRRGFGKRPRLLAELLRGWRDGRIKLYLLDVALDFRRQRPRLYLEGGYTPLEVEGPRRENVIAFARSLDGEWAVTAAPRLTAGLARAGKWPPGEEAWKETAIVLPEDAPSRWENVLAGESVEASGGRLLAAALLRLFPAALLKPHGA